MLCPLIFLKAITAPVWSLLDSSVVEFTCCGAVRILAQVTKLIDPLPEISRPWVLLSGIVERVRRINFVTRIRMYKIKMLAILVAFVAHEEFQNALIPKVARVKSVLVKRMYERISEHISYALDIYHDEISSCKLPGEMAQSLGYLRFFRV